jgi:signal transduction histidine kinase
VEQLLTNLIDNACRYTPDGSRLDLAAWRDVNTLQLELADHGPGLDPDDVHRIFETFQRGARSRADSRGAGLGLAICRAVAEAHSGTITARNAPQGGAVFRVSLPQHEPAPSVAFLEEDGDDE